jgi:hypothetical protein
MTKIFNGNGFGIIIKSILAVGITVLSAVIIQMYQTVNETAIDVAIIKQQQQNMILNDAKQDKKIYELSNKINNRVK